MAYHRAILLCSIHGNVAQLGMSGDWVGGGEQSRDMEHRESCYLIRFNFIRDLTLLVPIVASCMIAREFRSVGKKVENGNGDMTSGAQMAV